MRNSEDCDEGWYPIMHMNDRTRSAEHLGDLRLKLKYEEQIVLPLVNYEEIMDVSLNLIYRGNIDAFTNNVL